MENAAKALEIAGGVLIALLIISLFVYMFNKVSYHQAVQNQNLETQKIEAFNKTYESYNKSILYGADVISVINMAISHNLLETEGSSYSDDTFGNRTYTWNKNDPNFIEVTFKLEDSIQASVKAYYDDEIAKGMILDPEVIESLEVADPVLDAYTNPGISSTRIEYKLSKDMDKIKLILPSESGTVIKHNKRLGITLIAEQAYEDFISRIFKCEQISYNVETGRVNKIVFSEHKTSD